jgi:prepilin-type N-terminal cleavage/methylation domain-containing protein
VTSEQIHPESGFTLIEVLVAMVVLAVGLMGLQALGVGAARSVAMAERHTSYTSIASDSLESAMHQLRDGNVPTQFCQGDLRFGDRLSRIVDLSNPALAQVTVRVIPNPDSQNAPSSTFEISSSLYLPVALGGAPTGAPCS